MGRDTYDHANLRNPIGKFLMNKYFEKLSEKLKTIKFSNAIDLGAGKGYVTNFVGKTKGTYPIALDNDEEKLDFIRKKYPLIKVVKGDVREIPFEKNYFDFVISTQTIEHLSKDDSKRTLEEISRIGKKNCIITVPNFPYWNLKNIARGKYLKSFGNTPDHLQQWTSKGFEKMLKNYFENVSVERVYCWNFASVSNE
ncbi:MAG TPA: class I SAM-dependent methyltransferase [Candidatus Nanoarchaeia archaeon]|nr:class I SAM-dependent methyltransferase [Candidatus Nanoarchaeia archaeon]